MRVGTVGLVETVGEGVGDCGEGEGESGGLAVAGSGGADVMAGGRGAAAEPHPFYTVIKFKIKIVLPPYWAIHYTINK